MKYKNAQEVLPDRLLKELQQYVSGETIYVPNTQAKRQWGETSGSRSYYKQRNSQIREKYQCGVPIEVLADEYNLSADSIRKIVYSKP